MMTVNRPVDARNFRVGVEKGTIAEFEVLMLFIYF